MNIDEIKLMFEYNTWADQRILAAAGRVTPEQFAAPTTSGVSFVSLRGTLVHMASAQNIWRLRLTGYYAKDLTQAEFDAVKIKEADFPTLHAVEERYQADKQKMLDFVHSLTDESVNSKIRYFASPGTPVERIVWQCLYHFVNHGTQHRAEAAALLTAYGQSPGDVDFNSVFLAERGNKAD